MGMPKGTKKQTKKKTKTNKKFQKKPYGRSGGNDMMETDETPKPEPVSSSHALLKQQTAEWKKMKAEVAELKRKRKNLGKKEKANKKSISKEIKKLLADMTEKHVQERRAAGIDKASHKDRDMIAEMEANDIE